MTIQDAFISLEAAVEAFLAKGDEFEVLSAVFKLNNEIGRLLVLSRDPELEDLQLRVNEVTVAAKRNDRKQLRLALERVRAGVIGMQEST